MNYCEVFYHIVVEGKPSVHIDNLNTQATLFYCGYGYKFNLPNTLLVYHLGGLSSFDLYSKHIEVI
jgi:hypothetical protein